MKKLSQLKLLVVIGLLGILAASPVWSFCGFYVSKADVKLFNKASQVIIARDGQRTVLTMANDFQGDVKDFAVVVPVPVVLSKDQVHIGNPKILARLDAYSAPRLVEYFDPDPCSMRMLEKGAMSSASPRAKAKQQDALGVTIHRQFSVGEYDIVILGAERSAGLETWLHQNGYRIPAGAAELLKPYIGQNMKFFVAKVNLAAYNKSGFAFLRPLQMAYESPKFMLPIRLGMVNAQQAQDLVIYILSPKGRAEVTNYRTVNIPSDKDIPLYIRDEFLNFYTAMFNHAYEHENKNVVFLEYAWDMNWCDPCADSPLSHEELKQAGVFWLDELREPSWRNSPRPILRGGSNAYITRLHVRYTRDKFPEDLVFQETPNRENFQGRFVLHHPFAGKLECEIGNNYAYQVAQLHEEEAMNLANLTGWDINEIRKKMNLKLTPQQKNWWKKIFGKLH